jgi:hypothetical protein
MNLPLRNKRKLQSAHPNQALFAAKSHCARRPLRKHFILRII